MLRLRNIYGATQVSRRALLTASRRPTRWISFGFDDSSYALSTGRRFFRDQDFQFRSLSTHLKKDDNERDEDTSDKKEEESSEKKPKKKRIAETDALDKYWAKEDPLMLLKQPKKAAKEEVSYPVKAFRLVGKGVGKVWLYITEPWRFPMLMGHIWGVIKHEAHHYWSGTKLLAADVRVAVSKLIKIVRGKKLSRRERRQLVQTTADIFRLVPMSVFVIIPFMELLLPIALKIFPNMLPSTFQDKHKKEEQIKKELIGRMNMALFLQDTVESMGKARVKDSDNALYNQRKTLEAIMTKVRAGERVDNEEIVQLAELFDDEITIDNLNRQQLVQLTEFLGISPFGSLFMLRERLYAKFRAIKADDEQIQAEGIDNLTRDELRAALQDRGMRNVGLTTLGYRRNLAQYLDLSLNHHVPTSLLIMSRAFNITEARPIAPSRALQDSISGLGIDTIEEAVSANVVGTAEERLENLKRQSKLIIEEEQAEAEAAAAAVEEEEKLQQAEALESQLETEATPLSEVDISLGAQAEEEAAFEADDSLDADTLKEVAAKLDKLTSESAVEEERRLLESMKQKAEEEEEFEDRLEEELDILEDDLQDREERYTETEEASHTVVTSVAKAKEEEVVESDTTQGELEKEVEQEVAAAEEDMQKLIQAEADESRRQEEEERQTAIDEEHTRAEEFTPSKELQEPEEEQTREELQALALERKEQAKKEADKQINNMRSAVAQMRSALKGREALADSVDDMIRDLEKQIQDVDEKIGSSLKLLDKDNDGLVTFDEMEDVLEDIMGDKDLAEKTLKTFLEKGHVTTEDELSVEKLHSLAEELGRDADGSAISRTQLKCWKDVQGDRNAKL